MRCANCGDSDLVPIVYGSPDKSAWGAMLRGRLYLGGSITSDEPRWYCQNCSHELTADRAEYERSVADAICCDGPNGQPTSSAMDLMMGRRAAQRTVYEFTRMGASAIKLLIEEPENSALGLIDGSWEEFEWPIAKYVSCMIEANRCGQIRPRVTVGGKSMQVAATEVCSAGEEGLLFEISEAFDAV